MHWGEEYAGLCLVSVPACFWLLVIVFDFLFILPVKEMVTNWDEQLLSCWYCITKKRSNICYGMLHTYYIINKKVTSPPNIDEVHYKVVTLTALTYDVSH